MTKAAKMPRSGAVKRKPWRVRERKTERPARAGAGSTPARVRRAIGALLVLGEDRLHALDRLVGGLVGRPFLDGDAGHGLASDVLVVDLGDRRVLVVLEDLVVALQEDGRGHRDVVVLLAPGSPVTRPPEWICVEVFEGREPAPVGRLDVLQEARGLEHEQDKVLGQLLALAVLQDDAGLDGR